MSTRKPSAATAQIVHFTAEEMRGVEGSATDIRTSGYHIRPRASESVTREKAAAKLPVTLHAAQICPLFWSIFARGDFGREGKTAKVETIPFFSAAVDDRSRGQFPEGRAGRAVFAIGRDAGFFAADHGLDSGRRSAEAEFAIEPEGSGLDGFFVFVTELVGVDRITSDAEMVAENFENPRVEPGGFTFAESVIEIEAGFHALEQRKPFEVSDGDAVLEKHPGVICAQRETPLAGDAEEVEIDAAAEVGMIDVRGVGIGEAPQLAIPHGGRIENHVENLLGAGDAGQGNLRGGEFAFERDVAAFEERTTVIEDIPARNARARARRRRIAEFPAERDLEQIVGFAIDAGEQPLQISPGAAEPVAPIEVGFDGRVLAGKWNDMSEHRAEAAGMVVVVPIDRERVSGGEANGDVVAESSREAGAGDSGNFGIFEEIAVETAEARGEREQDLVGEPENVGALRVGAEIENEFVKADQIGGKTKLRLTGALQESNRGSRGCGAELALHRLEIVEHGRHSVTFPGC